MLVFFSRGVGLWFAIRSGWLRKPMYIYAFLLYYYCRIMTLSPLIHVAPAGSGVVADVSIMGTRFWSLLKFIKIYPSLDGYIHVPNRCVDGDITVPDYDRYENRKYPPSALRATLKHITFGLYNRSEDCVTVTKDVLLQAGVEVPRRVTSPVGVKRWLIRRGYAYHAI